jgi:hypothetical protein
MKVLVDVINFNADASCLSSAEWLKILEGGCGSKFCKWLNLYVAKRKMVVLGLPGATVSDLATFNPEAIRLINANPDIFEIILRPFAHDVGLLRQGFGFEVNFQYGKHIIDKEFSNIANYFLPPEFMATNDQIYKMQKMGVKGIFSNPSRFSNEIKDRLPKVPFQLKGFDGVQMECIPFEEGLTKKYLWAIQQFDCTPWNLHIIESSKKFIFSWRDGESLFFLPDGIEREEYWLSYEAEGIQRSHLQSKPYQITLTEDLTAEQFHAYPIHSCLSWMREFRLLGFINRILKIENILDTLSEKEIHYWLLVINSDIMSSIEKTSPVVNLKMLAESDNFINHKIYRSERWFEGEEYLMRLENFDLFHGVIESVRENVPPHIIKMNSRLAYLESIKKSTIVEPNEH